MYSGDLPPAPRRCCPSVFAARSDPKAKVVDEVDDAPLGDLLQRGRALKGYSKGYSGALKGNQGALEGYSRVLSWHSRGTTRALTVLRMARSFEPMSIRCRSSAALLAAYELSPSA
jgi:hypothetical protein